MPSSIRLRCPGCSARIKAPAELSGQKRNCPGCNRPLLIKTTPPEDSDAVLLAMETPAPSVRRRR